MDTIKIMSLICMKISPSVLLVWVKLTMFFIKSKYTNDKFELISNSLLIMKFPTSRYFSHNILHQRKRSGVRFNLIFRSMTNENSSSNKHKHEEATSATSEQAKYGYEGGKYGYGYEIWVLQRRMKIRKSRKKNLI